MAVAVFLLSLAPVLALRDDQFLFGASTAAYQIEGFRSEDGRSPSIWDAFDTANVSPNLVPGVTPSGVNNTHGGEGGEVADQDYLHYEDTTALLKSYGFDAYRFSLSWTRIMSYKLRNCSGADAKNTCKLEMTVNQAGIDHYKNVFANLKKNNIAAAVTMWHWDTPLAIEEWALITECAETNAFTADQTGSAWLCPAFIDIFEEYAKMCLQEFGSFADTWITLNEPMTVINVGYAVGAHAPGRCSDRTKCWHGNTTIEPYYAAKNMMLAHAKVMRIEGAPVTKMSFAANGDWKEPISSCKADQQAAVNAIVWQMPILWDLLATGDWSPEVKAKVPYPRLPKITVEERIMLEGAHSNLYQQNMYTSTYVWASSDDVTPDCPQPNADFRKPVKGGDFGTDSRALSGIMNPMNNEFIGDLAPGSAWLRFTPTGLAKLQRFLNQRYLDLSLKFLVTENGWGGKYDTKETALNDFQRCEYYKQYMGNMSTYAGGDYGDGPLKLSDEFPSIIGYFAWSLMDNYEWADGYSQRFGMTYVEYCGVHNDYICDQTRTPKLSATWFSNFMKQPQFRSLDLSTWGDLPECKWYA